MKSSVTKPATAVEQCQVKSRKVEFPSRTPRQDKLLQIPTLTTALNPGQYNWGLRRSYMVYRVYPSCILAVSADQKTVSK